ncbi:sigma 54-interacting transcriptional regulator [Sandaracinus amylolyticus]|uniref:Response regulator of zinc sigma-54-dependent two-component system n=1 Tax=Sandaracinus amylolyticus TaxID=927083 RepID=A0A0F6W5I4_9BACT|nr:sigma 54-interacting transcriptional regulator [Sandaracinus amylolyticus]AKF08006.1 Response regulator of zinc sigma-54-dependent two-component system [Sandaracinus amylolyticus]
MERIVLLRDGEPLQTFDLVGRGLEVGNRPGVDIAVYDPAVAERHCLLYLRDGEIAVLDLRDDGARAPTTLRPNEAFALSPRHALLRIVDATGPRATGALRTEPIAVREPELGRLTLVVGHHADARRHVLAARGVTIGSAKGCDVPLHDRSVSARHCRIEPCADGFVVRDLDSRNGTYVNGTRTYIARIGPGTRLRVGRTELRIVARDRSEAREDGLVASSPQMLKVLEKVERYAPTPFPVLIRGESGAGKEGIARALHLHGRRPDGPFVTVNAGGLAPSLIESELFGHEKGAFTGAMGQRRGVFEQAHGGTLFLDEIGELPAEMQARLLRVLETGEVRRVGAEHAFHVDVRLVCATHRDLQAKVKEGSFRQDLYYRIVTFMLEVPPLRQRPDDVRVLAMHFLATERGMTGPRSLSEAALQRLLAHDWPGNVRELRNVIQSAATASSGIVDVREVEEAIEEISGPSMRCDDDRASIADAVARYGSQAEAARALRIPRSTLRDRMRAETSRKKNRTG